MPHILRRQILNQVLEARASSSANLKDVETAYLRFPVPDVEAPATIVVEIDGQAVHGCLPAAKKELCQPLLANSLRSWQVQALASRLVLAAIRKDHDVFHGCAVETAAGTVVFIGGSGTGKSTLVLELGRLGYALLCEGQIPIDRATALVRPFPRGFEMFRENPGDRSSAGFRSEEKVVVPAPAVHAHRDSLLHSIVFLQDLFPGVSRQTIEVGCHPEEKACVIEVLANHGAYDMVSDTRDRRTLIRCRFSPRAGADLNGLAHELAGRGLNLLFFSFSPVASPDWGRALVATCISKAMATLGMGANASLATQHRAYDERDSGRLARFSRYAGQVQGYLVVNGSLGERTRWVMDHFQLTGSINC